MNEMSLRNHYVFDDQMHIWRRPEALNFAYSDGDETENVLYTAVKQAHDRSTHSDDLRTLQTDWVSTYHFSSLRSNLLRPFEETLLKGARVLELGCGCGAITRYLAETAEEVVAIDGSFRRASIAALRCEDMQKVTVIADTIQSIPPELGMFDVVTLIGVLEYARVYGDGAGADAELNLLQKARSFLKPGGSLILAIENKLGLKYLAGVPEDHLGLSWSGVLGTYTDRSVVTFSRKELSELLIEAGFGDMQQFIPVPDYKLPTTVIHPDGIATKESEFRKATLFALRLRPYEALPLFNTQQAWQSVCDAGLLKDMADSLCFVALNGQGQQKQHEIWPKNVLASHYGSSPSAMYAKEVRILKTSEGLHVKRRSLSSSVDSSRGKIRQNLQDESYVQGELLFERLKCIMLRKGWTVSQIVEELSPWYRWLLTQKLPGTDQVPFVLMDASPFNIIINKQGELVFFDQEWSSEKTISLSAVMLRTLLITFSMMGPVATPAEQHATAIFDFTLEILHYFNVPIKEDHAAFVFEAYQPDQELLGVAPSLNTVKAMQLPIMFENTHLPYALKSKLTKTEHVLQETRHILSAVYHSRSWRLTKPFRWLAMFVRKHKR